MTVFGWDASNHDWPRGPMDLNAAASAGIQFFTHKATDGLRYYKDPYFEQAMSRARAAGIPLLGGYHVLWNGNVGAQLDWFLSQLDAECPWWRSGPYLLQLDCEPFGYNGGAPTPATVRQACDYLVQATGGAYRPVVYAPKWVYGDTLAGLPYPLWASAYGTNPTGAFTSGYPGDTSSRWAPYSGQTPAILQYGSQLTIGSQPGCDANAFRGSLDQLRALIKEGTAVDATQEDVVGLLVTGQSTAGFVDQVIHNPLAQQAGHFNLRAISAQLDELAAKVGQPAAAGAPTQEQLNAAMLAALKDPSVIADLAAALASHLHVS